MTDIETIRRRHCECCVAIPLTDWEPEGGQAHVDRADLIRIVDALSAELAAERAKGERMREALNTIGNSLVCAPTDYAEHNASELLKAGNITRAAPNQEGGQ